MMSIEGYNPLIPTFDPNYPRDILVPLMNLIFNALLKGNLGASSTAAKRSGSPRGCNSRIAELKQICRFSNRQCNYHNKQHRAWRRVFVLDRNRASTGQNTSQQFGRIGDFWPLCALTQGAATMRLRGHYNKCNAPSVRVPLLQANRAAASQGLQANSVKKFQPIWRQKS